MQNLTVHLGSASPLSLPLEPARSAPARRCLNSDVLPRAWQPGHDRPGHGRGLAPRRRPAPCVTFAAGPPLSFLSLSAVPPTEPLNARPRPLVHSLDTDPAPAPLSSAASLPTISAPVAPPPATGGLTLTSDFTERRRRLLPLR
jgi:hypothetical protein